jgi:uncharacterized protein YbjT (DUF2867 family)
LTGATGYIGGRLLPLLERRGLRVRCLARTPSYLAHRVGESTEVVKGDVLDPASLDEAFRGIDVAYYLVHAMGTSGEFEEQELEAARNFARAAEKAGVRRMVYLGGLADEAAGLSKHLRSRMETGRVLRASAVPTLEFRASIVVGAGSLSFEMIRSLVQKLPVMTTPRWVSVEAQPIAVSDLLDYLLQALDVPLDESRVYEIGGADVVTYGGIMREYARQRGLRRWLIPVPFLTPWLSSLWLGLVTPLFARVGRRLIEGVRHPTIVRNPDALEAFTVKPKTTAEAVAEALRDEEALFESTRWSDSLTAGDTLPRWGGVRFGSRLVDSREVRVSATPEAVFHAVQSIGGRQGWYYGNALWQLRGALDLLVGGVGMRRGRRHPFELRAGDVIDCWRVEEVQSPRVLRLLAEMKLPGRAWLVFEVEPHGEAAALRQTAIFDPLGLAGLMYWYGIYPLHALVFRGMIRGLARAAETPSRED